MMGGESFAENKNSDKKLQSRADKLRETQGGKREQLRALSE